MSSGSGTTGGASEVSKRPAARVPLFTADAWAPLKVELFRSLWIATSIAQIGTWAREAAGPTLMANLTMGRHDQPDMVAKVLVYSNLPICLFSVLAGAAADVFDRRIVLIVTQIWMVVFSALLGVLTLEHAVKPSTLLGITFLLGTGTAAFGPALQAVLPELVPPKHFSLAINMNSIALNVARAVGPALFILAVGLFPHGNQGAGVSFLVTALSFVAALWVLWRWDRPPQRAAVQGEVAWNAIRAGFRYTVHSPANRAILLRVLTFIVPAVVLWGQVPIIAERQLHFVARGEEITALLFTFVGSGAIFGVFLMPGLHGRYRIDPVVNVCTAFFALGLIALSYTHQLWLAALILIFLGINWVIIPTNFNTATQKSVPLWVKGRAISFYLTVLFGSFAIGGQLWGSVTTATSIHTSLLIAGVSMLVLLLLAVRYPLTLNEGKDLAVIHAATPGEDVLGPRPTGDAGIQLAIRYRVPGHRSRAFNGLLNDLRRIRLRNGARRWTVEREDESSGTHHLFIERVVFASWPEYARYHSRTTRWDGMVESLAREYLIGRDQPSPVTAAATLHRSTSAAQQQPRAGWVENQLDRLIDEMFRIYDRLHAGDRSRADLTATDSPISRDGGV